MKTPEDFLFKHVTKVTNLGAVTNAMDDYANYKLEQAKTLLYKAYLDSEKLAKLLVKIDKLKS